MDHRRQQSARLLGWRMVCGRSHVVLRRLGVRAADRVVHEHVHEHFGHNLCRSVVRAEDHTLQPDAHNHSRRGHGVSAGSGSTRMGASSQWEWDRAMALVSARLTCRTHPPRRLTLTRAATLKRVRERNTGARGQRQGSRAVASVALWLASLVALLARTFVQPQSAEEHALPSETGHARTH